MLKIKEKFFDRFEQSFKLMKGNFFGLLIPIFFYKVSAFLLFDTFLGALLLSSIGSIENIENFNIGLFLSDPGIVLIIAIGIFGFLIYLLLYIVIVLYIFKSIYQSIIGEKINIQNNLLYGIKRFFSSMKTYWFMFVYVYLIPALVFIVGGTFLNMGLFKNIDSLTYFGGLIMIISILILIPFLIYRGTKATFALYSAVDNDSFEKENFNQSVDITNDNWWRIFGNVFLVGIIIGFGISMIESTIGLFMFGISGGGSSLYDGISNAIISNNPEIAITTITDFIQNRSMIFDLFDSIISITLQSIGTVFIFIFIYLLYLRIFREVEYKKNNNLDIKIAEKKKNIEL